MSGGMKSLLVDLVGLDEMLAQIAGVGICNTGQALTTEQAGKGIPAGVLEIEPNIRSALGRSG